MHSEFDLQSSSHVSPQEEISEQKINMLIEKRMSNVRLGFCVVEVYDASQNSLSLSWQACSWVLSVSVHEANLTVCSTGVPVLGE